MKINTYLFNYSIIGVLMVLFIILNMVFLEDGNGTLIGSAGLLGMLIVGYWAGILDAKEKLRRNIEKVAREERKKIPIKK